MNDYAMVCKNVVIDIVKNSPSKPVWPPDVKGNPVIPIPCNSSNIERGMIYDVNDGTFHYAEHIDPGEFFEDIVVEKLTESEERQIDILLNTEYIACMLESQLM